MNTINQDMPKLYEGLSFAACRLKRRRRDLGDNDLGDNDLGDRSAEDKGNSFKYDDLGMKNDSLVLGGDSAFLISVTM
jgi:hypothetical protein